LLEDLEFACENGTPALMRKVEAFAKFLGPVIQYERASSVSGIRELLSVEFGEFDGARDFVANPRGLYMGRGGSVGIAAASPGGEAALELMQRGLAAIRKSSLPNAAAAQAVSALGEFEANIIQHSTDSAMGIVAYELTPTFLGLYSSDLGQGVLASLRKNPTYAFLDDEGEALKLALQEGVSSSTEVGRGQGFRPIFVGLASHLGLLRFRSGDSLLELNGFAGGPARQELKERAAVTGFHVSVHCTFGR
jgi:hypothetical protein